MPEVIEIFDVHDVEAALQRGVDALTGGGVIVLPTETVYGAAVLLNQKKALKRLRALREGKADRPFTVHVSSPDAAMRYLDEPNDLARRMMRKLWPGPVALVFNVSAKRREAVAKDAGIDASDIYDGDSITLRCPDHPIATVVLEAANGPVALTLVQADDWTALGDKVDLVFNAGPTNYSKPSTIVRVHSDQYEIVREGVYDQRIIERMLKTTVLFVCSGNTCRSPMAEALARKGFSKKLGIPEQDLESRGLSVISAGSFAMPGARATPAAVDAVRELGGDLSRHRSHPLSVELIHQADRIFTMGRSHAAAVASLVPSAVPRLSTLDPNGDIEDPIGGDTALYLSLAKKLDGLIEQHVLDSVVI
jgi:protein-tyrosine phosphatase